MYILESENIGFFKAMSFDDSKYYSLKIFPLNSLTAYYDALLEILLYTISKQQIDRTSEDKYGFIIL